MSAKRRDEISGEADLSFFSAFTRHPGRMKPGDGEGDEEEEEEEEEDEEVEEDDEEIRQLPPLP